MAAKVTASFGIKTGIGAQKAAARGNPIMIAAVSNALQNVTAKQIQDGYNKMTENWTDHPVFEFRVVKVHMGTQISWRLKGEGTNDVNLKWAMVDFAGRKGGKVIQNRENVEQAGAIYKAVAGRAAGKKLTQAKKSLEAGQFVAYKPDQIVGRVTSKKKGMPIRPYNPSTIWPFKFGGSKTYNDPVAIRGSVKQGAVIPRGLTSQQVMTALRGQGSELSNIIKPIVGRRNRGENPVYVAYRAATKAIGRGILASASRKGAAEKEYARMKELYEREMSKL